MALARSVNRSSSVDFALNEDSNGPDEQKEGAASPSLPTDGGGAASTRVASVGASLSSMETDVSRAMQYVRSSQEEMMQLVSTMSEQAIVKKQ